MLFLLATPEYNNLQSNTTKVRVHLRNGVAEVFDQHQDLMGKVDNNIIEIETNFENRIEKILFVLQDAVFIVSNKVNVFIFWSIVFEHPIIVPTGNSCFSFSNISLVILLSKQRLLNQMRT